MNCPTCDEKLREIEKLGVTVDICPGCKGVWLDRGELEKILKMAESGESQPDNSYRESSEPRQYSRDHDSHHDDERRDSSHRESSERGYGKQKRKGSWLGDIIGGFGGDD